MAAGVSAPVVGTGSSGSSGGGGGGGGGTVTATALGSATAQVTLGSINYDYDFYADEAKTTPVNYAAALLAPYYLDPDESTVQLFGDGEGEESPEVSLSDLNLSDDGQTAYDGMDDMKNAFQFGESDDWIPSRIVLNLKSRTAVNGKNVASPWEKTIEIDIGEAFDVFALNADKDQLTIYNFMGQPLAGEDLNNITGNLLLQAEGWLGSEISWESSNESLISISVQKATYDIGGHPLDFYLATVNRSVYSDETVTLTATLSMDGSQGTLTKEFNLTVKQEEDVTPPTVDLDKFSVIENAGPTEEQLFGWPGAVSEGGATVRAYLWVDANTNGLVDEGELGPAINLGISGDDGSVAPANIGNLDPGTYKFVITATDAAHNESAKDASAAKTIII